MGIIRPATPGFLTTLAATVLLVIVVFCVPYFKSIYFLKASLSDSGVTGSITLGTLGYCLNLPGNVTCSKPSIGYEFDPNSLLGNKTPIEIPAVVVKWLTYALVLHVVALVAAGISALFGLLAHVRELSMSCFSTCISGFGAAICLLAFIFDIIFFFVVKKRINSVKGGSASFGVAVWMTLAAWILLFISGCVYSLGRCCITTRGPDYERRRKRGRDEEDDVKGGFNPQSEALRLDAVRAEEERKSRARDGKREVGLPTFQEYERTPLTRDNVYLETGPSYLPPNHSNIPQGSYPTTLANNSPRRQPSQEPGPFPGGYAGGTPGTRAVDTSWSTDPNTAVPNMPAAATRYGSPPSQTNYNNLPNPGVPQTPEPVHSQAYGQNYGQGSNVDPMNFPTVVAVGAAAMPNPKRQTSLGYSPYSNLAPTRQGTDPYDPYGPQNTSPGQIFGPRRQNSQPTPQQFSNLSPAQSPEPRIPDIYAQQSVLATAGSFDPYVTSHRQQTDYYDPYAQDQTHYPTSHTPPVHTASPPASSPPPTRDFLRVNSNVAQHGSAFTTSPTDQGSVQGLPYDRRVESPEPQQHQPNWNASTELDDPQLAFPPAIQHHNLECGDELYMRHHVRSLPRVAII
ncbi:SUR7/PalI family-domain-containing protein [Cantharellus anzutake]|uniref:SUR7/PalI family-domain-containing protein n=1 Tax=Cantharellus anzutake TaxID=1750568 RepID=UPI0019046E4F|nr:SUR7/PalI family-domain-containing protein [Cantharellus anzutake]KAF8320633.1 SUR7/PalI family-domain-containing protein [Cantharellus anzutake]